MTSPNGSFQHWSTEAANFQIWQLRFPVAPRGELSTVLLTPKLFVLAGVHEFGADREIVASLNNSSNNQRLDAKLARYLLGFDVGLSADAERASRRNRSKACGSFASSSGRNFRATWRPSLRSSASYTTPMPPPPILRSMR